MLGFGYTKHACYNRNDYYDIICVLNVTKQLWLRNTLSIHIISRIVPVIHTIAISDINGVKYFLYYIGEYKYITCLI